MSYFLRLIFLFGVILFSVLLKSSAIQDSPDPEVTPSIRRILINGDSVIFISDSTRVPHTDLRQNIILNHRYNNVEFELQPR